MWRWKLAGWLLALAVLLLAVPAPASAADTNLLDAQSLDDTSQVQQLTEALKKHGVSTDSLMDEHFLFASLLWGSVGAGYLVYARKQRAAVPFVGGTAMIVASYFINSWVWMSVACIVIIVGVYQVMRRGY